jgi:hypothetical protein
MTSFEVQVHHATDIDPVERDEESGMDEHRTYQLRS